MDNPVTPAPPEEDSIEAQLTGQPTESAAPQTTPPPAPANQPAPVMDIVAPPRSDLAQAPAEVPEPAQPAAPAAPAPHLPKLEQEAPKPQPKPMNKPASDHKPGVGMAIAATVIIVIALSTLAVLAFMNQ